MASRLFNQFLSSFNFNPVLVEGSFRLGSTGAVVQSGFSGAGITASSTLTVQKLGLGYYKLQLADPYQRILGWNFMPMPGPSSVISIENSGNIILGRAYQILNGTSASHITATAPTTSTNWYTLGLDPNLTPVAGQVFIATSGVSTVEPDVPGQGRVQLLGISPITQIQALPCVNTALSPSSARNNGNGAMLYFQTLAASSTTNGLVRIDATSSIIRYNLILRNSDRRGYNEASTSN